MAHEFESGFYVREAAWHKLGKTLAAPPTIEEGLRVAGLDWTVKSNPIYVNLLHRAGVPMQTRIPSHKALVRSTDQKILGVVGQSYQPVQNQDAFRFFNMFVEDRLVTLDAAGSLRGGAVVWVLAKVAQAQGDVVPGDPVTMYLCLVNGHDGHTKLHLMFTQIRVVCMNTVRMALGSNAAKLTFKHTPNVLASLDAARSTVDIARRTFTLSMEEYRAMARKGLQASAFKSYVQKVFESEADETPRSFEALERLFENGAGNSRAGVRGTLWAAYNAVTEWVDHERGHEEDTRATASWFGEGGKLRERARTEALALI